MKGHSFVPMGVCRHLVFESVQLLVLSLKIFAGLQNHPGHLYILTKEQIATTLAKNIKTLGWNIISRKIKPATQHHSGLLQLRQINVKCMTNKCKTHGKPYATLPYHNRPVLTQLNTISNGRSVQNFPLNWAAVIPNRLLSLPSN